MNSSDELAGLPFPTDGSTVLAVPTDLRREGGSFVLAVPVSLKSQLRFVLAVADLALSPFFFFFFSFFLGSVRLIHVNLCLCLCI